MIYFKTLKEFLLEKKSDSYSYGYVMINIDLPEMEKIHLDINKSDLYTEQGSRSYSLEDETHITLLYGLTNEVTEESVFNILDKFEIDSIKLVGISTFKNDKFDVLKFDVDSSVLHDINKELCKLPHENEFPDYNPHVTIAYLKKGRSDKYIEKFSSLKYTVNSNEYIYSKPDGNTITKNI